MGSRPLLFRGRHIVNSGMLAANVGTMGAFIAMAPGSPAIAAGALAANTVLSFAKGFTTTSAIGGADMREFSVGPTCDLDCEMGSGSLDEVRFVAVY